MQDEALALLTRAGLRVSEDGVGFASAGDPDESW